LLNFVACLTLALVFASSNLHANARDVKDHDQVLAEDSYELAITQ